MTTTFDDCMREFKQHLQKASDELDVMLNEHTWGYEDIKEEYIDELHEFRIQLLKFRRKL